MTSMVGAGIAVPVSKINPSRNDNHKQKIISYSKNSSYNRYNYPLL